MKERKILFLIIFLILVVCSIMFIVIGVKSN